MRAQTAQRIDSARYRVKLTDAELADVMKTGVQQDDAAAAIGQAAKTLRAADVLDDGELPGWLAALLGVVARPALRIVVETLRGGEPLPFSIWATPDQAVAGGPRSDGLSELKLVEVVTIPWVITEEVGLGRRPSPPAVSPIAVPASVLATCESQVDAEGSDVDLSETLRDQDVAAPQIGVLKQLLLLRRVSWRAGSVWTDATGARRTKSFAVMDGGDAGVWFVDVRAQHESDDPVITLQPSTAGVVWQKIVSLFPEST